MLNAVPAIPFVLAATIGAFTQDCHDICAPETIFMPEVPAPVISPDWSHPSSLNKWLQKPYQVPVFDDGSWN